MNTDKRYTINLESCGYSVQMHCVRFHDKLIGVARDEIKAAHIVETHNQRQEEKALQEQTS